ECLTQEAARKIVAIRADEELQKRVDVLADKANTGTLSETEQFEYDRYLAAFHFVTIIRPVTAGNIVRAGDGTGGSTKKYLAPSEALVVVIHLARPPRTVKQFSAINKFKKRIPPTTITT
ncbi:MAG: hypothetical protein ACKOAH_24295, partial [Pirellula sp.]